MTVRGSRRWWALGALILAVLAITLDVTVLSIALPTLAGVFHASESQLQWFVTAYTLALVAGMLPSGLLGDRFGRKAVMIAALGLFALGSLACAYAPDAAIFIMARVAVAVAGAAVIVGALSVIPVLFPEEERPRAVGIWGAANFIGLPLGPILGGWILSHLWWGWIFLMNLPVTFLALGAVIVLVPSSRGVTKASGMDPLGMLLVSAGLVALMDGVIEAGSTGWGSVDALLPVATGTLVLVCFGRWERRLSRLPGAEPLIDVSLFRSWRFTWGVFLTALGAFGLFGVMFALPQYVQAVMGLGPQASGIRLLPLVGGLIVGAVAADRIAVRMGARLTTAAGFLVVAAGSVAGATMTVDSRGLFITGWTFVVGMGAGLGFVTAASGAVAELTTERSGVGSAFLQVVVKLGPAFGASVLGSVLNSTYQRGLNLVGIPAAAAAAAKGSVFAGVTVARELGSPTLLTSVRTAFVTGMDHAMDATAMVALAAVVLALVFLPGRSAGAGESGPKTG